VWRYILPKSETPFTWNSNQTWFRHGKSEIFTSDYKRKFLLKTAGRAGLKPIGPIASNWVPRVRGPAPSYQLLAVQVHTTTHNRFYIEQHWASQLPRTTLSVGLDSLFSTSFEDLYTCNIKWSFPNSIFHILSM
jgi:hypothetical protein